MSAKTSTPISTIETLLVDTSAWFALVNRKEKNHKAADRLLTREKGYVYVTTDYIIDETITITAVKLGHRAAAKIGRILFSEKMIRVIHITPSLQKDAMRLFEKYDDKLFSFTDCTSFAVMERFSIAKALSFDSDFRKAGFESIPA